MIVQKFYWTNINNFEVSARYVGHGDFEDFKVVFKYPGILFKLIKCDPGETIEVTGDEGIKEKYKAPDENEIIRSLINKAIENNKP
jgi:hypothetical protein